MKVYLTVIMVYEVIAQSTSDFTRFPSGPKFCLEICQTLGCCLNPLFGENHLICVLEYSTKYHGLRELGYKQTKKKFCSGKSLHTDTRPARSILSRNGKELCVLGGTRRSCRAMDDKPEEKFYTMKIKFNITTKFKGCRVTSMTRSDRHPNLTYLLLQCSKKVCTTFLQFADIWSQLLTNCTLTLCAKSERRHIFIGPCVKSCSLCLYSVDIGLHWQLTTYREPSLDTTAIETDVTTSPKRCFDKKAVCAHFVNHTVVCFVQNTVKTIAIVYNSQLNEYQMKIVTTNWSYQPIVYNAMDMTYVAKSGKYIVVNVSHVNLLNADVSKMEIRKQWSTSFYRGYSLAMIGDNVLLSSKYLRQPFYLCSLRNLRKCIDSLIFY